MLGKIIGGNIDGPPSLELSQAVHHERDIKGTRGIEVVGLCISHQDILGAQILVKGVLAEHNDTAVVEALGNEIAERLGTASRQSRSFLTSITAY